MKTVECISFLISFLTVSKHCFLQAIQGGSLKSFSVRQCFFLPGLNISNSSMICWASSIRGKPSSNFSLLNNFHLPSCPFVKKLSRILGFRRIFQRFEMGPKIGVGICLEGVIHILEPCLEGSSISSPRT